LFAEKLLGIELSGERLPPRRIDLSPLLDLDELDQAPMPRFTRAEWAP
jgi:hypothetical protein